MWFLFQKSPCQPWCSPRAAWNWNLIEMQLIGSEIIATRIVDENAGRRTDEWHVEDPYHELCWQSQAELKGGGEEQWYALALYLHLRFTCLSLVPNWHLKLLSCSLTHPRAVTMYIRVHNDLINPFARLCSASKYNSWYLYMEHVTN